MIDYKSIKLAGIHVFTHKFASNKLFITFINQTNIIMKKRLLAGVFATLILASCTYNEEEVLNNTDTTKQSSTLLHLQEINDSIIKSNNILSSRARGRDMLLAYADIKGAIKGGKTGIKIGAAIGSFSPAIGNVGGAFIGGLIGASITSIGASYLAYCALDNTDQHTTTPSIDKITYAYCCNYDISTNESGSYQDDNNSTLELPWGLDSLENVGKYHNLTLDRLIKENSGIMTLSNGFEISGPIGDPIKPKRYITLSDFEYSVLDSDEYTTAFNDDMAAIANDKQIWTPDGSLHDSVMQLYLEAISYYSGTESINDIIAVTNQYISTIEQSEDLEDIEKRNLYIALSVGVYSYKFWTNYYE
ncbi:glycine zipper family protein [uncultured Muribaculum sp.]|uniref:glycine zipper family protein n=1 Tax=uncultured Muribaculum sp. TaxID=1918613 RepID=UPI0025B7797F|nr:glycine zipper family protein [uncultured Muribaculum sp.]